MSAKNQLDVLAVGDVVTDAFIDLIEKYEFVDQDKNGQPILNIPLGQKIPYDQSKIVNGAGNAANAAVCFARLGLKSGLVSNVGGDDWGRDILRSLKENGVDTRFVHQNPGKDSNYNYVLWYAEERTIFVKHQEYDYQWPILRRQDVPKWIYFSSVAKNALDYYHDEISEWLDANPEVQLAFQPGTFQLKEQLSRRLKKLYSRASVVVMNREEAVMVFEGDYENIHDLLDKMHQAGIGTALITDGPNGAYASDGQRRYMMPPYPDPAPPYERTGAGDAFASTFTAAVINGADLRTALQYAPINSMSVVQHIGSQEGLLTDQEIDHLLSVAPKNYYPREL